MIFSSRPFLQKTNERMKLQVDLFSFVFWRKLKSPKRHFEIIWPLVLPNWFKAIPINVIFAYFIQKKRPFNCLKHESKYNVDCWYMVFWNPKYSRSFHKNKNLFQPIVSSAQIQQKPSEMQKTLQFYPIICTKKQSFKIRFCQKYQKRRSLLPISASNSLYLNHVVSIFGPKKSSN